MSELDDLIHALRTEIGGETAETIRVVNDALTRIEQSVRAAEPNTVTTSNVFDDSEASAYTGMSESFFRQSRSNRGRPGRTPGPVHIKIGRAVRYLRADLDEWLARHRVTCGEEALNHATPRGRRRVKRRKLPDAVGVSPEEGHRRIDAQIRTDIGEPPIDYAETGEVA